MGNILVTGGAGYVGSVCCAQLLEHGHVVVVADDLSSGCAASLPRGATFYQLDIGNRSGLSELLRCYEFDAVFHLAAKALIPESIANPGVFFDSNVASGIAMLETLRAAGLRKFVFSSSAAVYGSPDVVPILEDHQTIPVNAYGETKLAFERILKWYARAYGWSILILRYFNACGAAGGVGEDHKPETHLVPLLLQTALGRRPFFEIYGDDYPTPDGTCFRDFVHVLDIAEAHVQALESLDPPAVRIYNLGTGTSYSVNEVCRAVAAVTGCKLPLKVGPRRMGDPAVLCASPKKIMAELGWRPRHSELTEIIESAWIWAKDHPGGCHPDDQINEQTAPGTIQEQVHQSTRRARAQPKHSGGWTGGSQQPCRQESIRSDLSSSKEPKHPPNTNGFKPTL